MRTLLNALRHWKDWWWQGMAIHARQACRDESEALDRIRNLTGEPK
ncbi:hypothetical protein [Chromobacterium phragmitis]|uniref:Uncharacterized protein n=1 Tax=Chromobacterium phragmitis TaxID=2202141 RepID=A0ABV0ISX8_9NEIS